MLTQEQVQELEEYAYFWNPYGEWAIWESHTPMVCVSVSFNSANGPSVTELKQIRQWLPELAALPPAEARRKIGNSGTYQVGDLPGYTGELLIERAHELGLKIFVQWYPHVYRAPVHKNGTTGPIFEDEEELAYIVQKMREAGRPVILSEED